MVSCSSDAISSPWSKYASGRRGRRRRWTSTLIQTLNLTPLSLSFMNTLPILSWRRHQDPATRGAFLDELRVTLSTVGFFYLVDVDPVVDRELYDRTSKVARTFWDLPLETRLLIAQENSPQFRGYSSFGAETTWGKKDLRDQIDFGPELPLHPRAHPTTPALTSPLFLNLQGPNQFLPPSVLPDFQSTMLEYHAALLALSLDLTRAIGSTLLDDPDQVERDLMSLFEPHAHARMKIARYPCVSSRGEGGGDGGHARDVDGQGVVAEETSLGVGPHRDGGILTILMQDEIGGLQVQRWDGQWIDAPPLDVPSFVVNVGQQFAHLSSDRYPATTHRVLANRSPTGRARFSVPFFLSPDLERSVAPLARPQPPGPGAATPVKSDVREGDLLVGLEPYGASSFKGVSRSHRKVVERWYPLLLDA